MTNYTKATNFAAKDSLASGNAAKVVKGTEIDTEFTNIETAVNSKSDSANPVFTGVAEFADGSASAPSITNTGDTNTGIFFPAADTVGITTGGTEMARVDSSGNLGLGVTPSAWGSGFKAIDVNTYGAVASSTSALRLFANSYNDGTNWTYKTTAAASRYDLSGGAHAWLIAASGTAGNAITFTQAMTLDASGNLLVGGTSVTNPAGWSKGVQVYDANYPFLSIKNSTKQYDWAGYGGDLWLYDATAGAARMVIDSSGNLLVGTTSNPATSTTAQAFRIGPVSTGVQMILSGTETSSYAKISFNNGNGQVGTIQTSGSTTAYNTSSDYRLKENIAPMTGALAKVAQLKPVTYTWKINGLAGEGFIAHELQEVVAGCVSGEKDALDEDGNPIYQGIDTSFLVATLTAAIQEQQQIITQLQADVAALKGQA